MDNVIKTYLKILKEQAETEEEKDLDLDKTEETEESEEIIDDEGEGEGEGEEEADTDEGEEDLDEDEEDETEGNKLDTLIKKYSSKESITKDDIVDLLNIAICDELLAQYNYLRSYTLSKTEGKADFDEEFQAHETEELDHAHKLIKRLREMNAPVMTIAWADYVSNNSAGADWKDETEEDSKTILQNRYNEEIGAIKFYSLILECIRKMKESGEWDTSTERLIKSIKADEEEHEQDLRDLLVQYGVDIQIDTNAMPTDEEEELEEDEENDWEDTEDTDEAEEDAAEAEGESDEDEIEDEG